MNKLEAMRAFSLVCESSSFAEAANKMSVSATMMGKYIKSLENDLNCLLIKRNTRHISITEAGRCYLKEIEPLLSKLSQIELKMSRFNQTPQGRLTLSSSIEFGGQYLAPIIALYRQKYPDVSLEIDLSNQPSDLVSHEIDLAFRIAPSLPNASYIAIPICSSTLALWASPEYLSNCGLPREINDLFQHELLFFSHSIRQDEWLFQIGNEQSSVKLPWAWRTNNGRLLNEAAAKGHGIIQAPSYSVREYVQRGELIEIMPEHSIKKLTVSAVYSHSSDLSIALKSFIELAKTYFNDNPIP